MSCPVCGHVDGACIGNVPTNERQIITASGVKTQHGPERVKRPRTTRLGREGYVGDASGKLEYYDPEAPNIRLVVPETESIVEPVKIKAPRTRRAPRKKADDN